jgi:glyoxylase-like metal-dependent hydrolase (beta-lactamase superfamily II)
MTRVAVLALLILTGGVTLTFAARQAQQQQAPLPEATKVKENLWVIAGSSPVDRSKFTGGNTAVYVADSGVVVVDTKVPGFGPLLLERIKAVTSKPVIMIINTHTHFDHTGSNEGFPTSVEIVAHENTKANMEKMDAFKGDKARFVPKRTYKDKLSLLSGKDRIDVYHFGRGHTNGDSFIVFSSLRTAHAGDMFAWKDAPFLDRANGGSGVEFPQTLAKAVAGLKKDVDTVIPGHIPVATLADLDEYQRFNADLVASARAAMKAGKSLDQAVADAMGVVQKYKGYNSDRLKAAVEALYAELKQ